MSVEMIFVITSIILFVILSHADKKSIDKRSTDEKKTTDHEKSTDDKKSTNEEQNADQKVTNENQKDSNPPAEYFIVICSTFLQNKDYQHAIIAGEKAISLYPQNPFFYFCLGIGYLETGEFDVAIYNLKKAELFTKDKDVSLGNIYKVLGLAYLKKGNCVDALDYFEKSLNLYITLNYEKKIDKVYSKKNINEVSDMIMLSIVEGEKVVNFYPQDARNYLCLGRAYRLIKLFDLAISNLKNAELYAKDKEDLGHIYNELGLAYFYKGDDNNALDYLNKSLNIFITLNKREEIAEAYNNIALVYYHQGNSEKGLEYYRKFLEFKSDEKEKI